MLVSIEVKVQFDGHRYIMRDIPAVSQEFGRLVDVDEVVQHTQREAMGSG